jgi:probable F420-dependent oxidoreductase
LGVARSPSQPHCGLILALTIKGLAVGHYPDMVRVAQAAEAHGFDSIWLCDHFLTLSPADYVKDAGIAGRSDTRAISTRPASMPLLESWTTLAALARDTQNLRLGTSVLCNSYRYPSVLAKMAATLDVISDGRLDLGLGAGWFQREYEAYGIPYPSAGERVSALAESLEVIKAVWTQEYPTYRGRFYTLDGAVCDPQPRQRPHPPLWVGGEGDRVQRVAARSAQGINIRWWSPDQVRRRKDFLTQACDSVGRDPKTLQLSVTVLLAATESAQQEAEIHREFSSIPVAGVIVGSPEKCVDRIQQYRQAGVDHFLFTIPHVADSDNIHVVGQVILPMLKSSGMPA